MKIKKQPFLFNLRFIDIKKKIITLFLIISVSLISYGQETKEVLFLGNSYTYTHNVPNTIKLLANSNGDDLVFDTNTPGGYKLIQHATNTTSINKIQNTNWDHVILQDHSLGPAYSYLDFYKGAKELTQIISDDAPCINKTIFYMTWGRENNTSYPYSEMQQVTTDNYNKVATIFEAEVSPIGIAWKKVRDDGDPIHLYSSDGSHQSFAGTYLAACVFYATIFDNTPVGLSYTGSLSTSDANYLQQKAFEAYNEYVNLNLIHTGNSTDIVTDVYRAKLNNTETELTSLVENCCLNTSFDFTYSGVSTQSQVNTTLQYIIYQGGNEVENETVPVSMTITPNICVNQTATYPLNMDLTNVGGGQFFVDILLNGQLIDFYTLEKLLLPVSEFNLQNINVYPIPTSNNLFIDLDKHYDNLNVIIYDLLGRVRIEKKIVNSDKIAIDTYELNSGQYILKLFTKNNVIIKKIIKN